MKVFVAITVLVSLVLPASAAAKLKVVATLPSFADLARQVGGDEVDVTSLTKGTQDPHFVDAKPDLVLKLNKADLLLHAGLELEIGWLPVLVTGARNSKILNGAKGNLDCSTAASLKEVPQGKIDRSMGDVHPGGNPHYMLDPRNGSRVADVIARRLAELDPSHAAQFEQRRNAYSMKLMEKIKEWEKKLEPYRGTKIVTYHKSWVYFSDWAGLKEVGYVEPKPGIPPSPQHVAELVGNIKSLGVKLVLAEPYYPHDMAEMVARQTGAKFMVLPSEVGGAPEAKDYTSLIGYDVASVTHALEAK